MASALVPDPRLPARPAQPAGICSPASEFATTISKPLLTLRSARPLNQKPHRATWEQSISLSQK